MVAVTEFLIEKGAPLDAYNEDKKTAFALALECENIMILDMLTERISLKDDPLLLHDFKNKIFD